MTMTYLREPNPAGTGGPRAQPTNVSGDALAVLQSRLDRMTQACHALRRSLETVGEDRLLRLARAAEERDGETAGHLRRIGIVSGLIAEALGCPEDYCILLVKAAPMHDIGKIGIHESILRKPGPLTADEWRLMREHPRIGAGILAGSAAGSPLLTLAAEIAMTHHERFNGSGYPAGLADEAIPLSGRIVALADFFDSLAIDRCYRKARPDEEVLAMIRERSGEQFDPRIVGAFMSIVDSIILARDSINEVEELCQLASDHGDGGGWMLY